MSLIIREIKNTDFDQFSEIMDCFFRYSGDEPLSHDQLRTLFEKAIIPETNYSIICAIVEQKIVGIISITVGESSYKLKPFAWLDDFYVQEEHRSLGIGQALIQETEKIACNLGCSNLLVGVGETENDTRDFYEKRGFFDMNCRLYTRPL